MTNYKGTYPLRVDTISGVQGEKGVVHIRLNNGDLYRFRAAENNHEMPHPGDEISEYKAEKIEPERADGFATNAQWQGLQEKMERDPTARLDRIDNITHDLAELNDADLAALERVVVGLAMAAPSAERRTDVANALSDISYRLHQGWLEQGKQETKAGLAAAQSVRRRPSGTLGM